PILKISKIFLGSILGKARTNTGLPTKGREEESTADERRRTPIIEESPQFRRSQHSESGQRPRLLMSILNSVS
ncbi:MAG: hypothetical protein PHU85_04515, partial [Phycisphaerae bacterium]|nr:hypothetical protein [Phycisphaerae bacterium]